MFIKLQYSILIFCLLEINSFWVKAQGRIEFPQTDISDDNVRDSSSSSEEFSNTRRINHEIQFPNIKPIQYPVDNRANDSGRRKTKNENSRRNSGKRRICEIKYAEYMTRIFPSAEDQADANDSDFDGRVLAQPGEYPHMTAVGFSTETEDYDFKCGGSLISDRFVITAAHCTNLTGQQPVVVQIGDLNLIVAELSVEPQQRFIQNIHNHPNYQTDSYYNDIALLELRNNVVFTEYVRPIRLWVQYDIPYSIAYAMGYGATAFGKERTNRLTDMNMTIVPNADCDQELPAFEETSNGIIQSQICARDYAMNRDTCQGDSGGPLQLNIHGRRRRNRIHYHLIGITSYGMFCRSNYPSVYTRVSAFLDWIEEIVW